jgi:hypothetical protein
MKRLASTLLMLALIGLPAMAALGQQSKGETKPVKGPAIEVTPESHDFGKVKQNLNLETEFEIRNIGTEEVAIGRISTSCGCTAALTSDRVIKPGESTTLKVTLETRRYKGQIQRSVSVASNAVNKKIATVKVKAFVVEATDDSPR